MKRLIAALTVAALSVGAAPMAAAQTQKTDTHKGTGIVTRIDRNAGKVTLKHDPIPSLNWPGMTMAFEVKEKALLDKAKVGEKVEFSLVESGKKYIITAIK